jgi:hypothetical protein
MAQAAAKGMQTGYNTVFTTSYKGRIEEIKFKPKLC